MYENHQLDSSKARRNIRKAYLKDEKTAVTDLVNYLDISDDQRAATTSSAIELIGDIRAGQATVMERFLLEYGLTNNEGIALMCLAEALLRVPDAATIDALILDKLSDQDWRLHLGHSDSPFVNASTWALMLTGKVLSEQEKSSLITSAKSLVRKLGEPVLRTAVVQALKELGTQFVLGERIEQALKRARSFERKGYCYSYDMLGEAALCAEDADRYFSAYSNALQAIKSRAKSAEIRENPGLSVKLSALHPRYEYAQKQRVMDEMIPRLVELAVLAKGGNIGLNIDAEEAERLDLSLDIIEALLAHPALVDWDGLGVVVQAYGPRAFYVLDWLYSKAQEQDRKIMVRLVKGAYWDSEIKQAQILGLSKYPVFTAKNSTDISYIACARKLFAYNDRIYPQFATHNAHTTAAVLNLAPKDARYEFQRLHGMGEALHHIIVRKYKIRCRIYAPVGEHEDLLAYLVRRLLENGANSSFVNQIVDKSVNAADIAKDPVARVDEINYDWLHLPADVYEQGRVGSKGWDLNNPTVVSALHQDMAAFESHYWDFSEKGVGQAEISGAVSICRNPADSDDAVGRYHEAAPADIDKAACRAQAAQADWAGLQPGTRSATISAVADLYEAHTAELIALLIREAGKTHLDAVAEIREAVDFCRYYARENAINQGLCGRDARGVFACISPWNFPLAIFTGQIVAALVVGNAVLAKPAEQTSLVALRAVQLMYQAGVPEDVLILLPGQGETVGDALTSHAAIQGVCFTGSLEVANIINRNMARHMAPDAPLIAETGGLNAMVVDSTALPEQAVQDIVASAFQSAGQRCSALRVLYVQKDIEDKFLALLAGAMDELETGNPWALRIDVGPVIDPEAQGMIDQHCRKLADAGRLLKKCDLNEVVAAKGYFIAPALYRLNHINELAREIFGPVLHVISFESHELDQVVRDINETGYGLTFGMHSRVDKRVKAVSEAIDCGNIYVNRNQIGAVVGVQPFGGEGLSGTGPKAGGPNYLGKFTKSEALAAGMPSAGEDDVIAQADVQKAVDNLHQSLGRVSPDYVDLPGPTGESNRLCTLPRGVFLCSGNGDAGVANFAEKQVKLALATDNAVVLFVDSLKHISLTQKEKQRCHIFEGRLDSGGLKTMKNIAGLCAATERQARAVRQVLAERDGPILPLICRTDHPSDFQIERALCVNTMAAGGNVDLLAHAEA